MSAVDTVNARIPESSLQRAIVADLDSYLAREPGAFAYAAGLEGVRLNPRKGAEARAQGMKAGEPDLRFYLARGRMVLIELKAAGGTLNPAQKARHALLRGLGFDVHTVRAVTPAEAIAAVWAILRPQLT